MLAKSSILLYMTNSYKRTECQERSAHCAHSTIVPVNVTLPICKIATAKLVGSRACKSNIDLLTDAQWDPPQEEGFNQQSPCPGQDLSVAQCKGASATVYKAEAHLDAQSLSQHLNDLLCPQPPPYCIKFWSCLPHAD